MADLGSNKALQHKMFCRKQACDIHSILMLEPGTRLITYW